MVSARVLMNKVAELGSFEGWMCGHVAAALCKFVGQRNPQTGGEKGCPVMNTDMGDWARAKEALQTIGVMHQAPLYGSAKSWTVFSMDADEMPRHLATRIQGGDPRIDILMTAFIGVACAYASYGETPLSDERDWFTPPPQYLTAMHWLARGGYAESDGDTFRWTEKIGPAMRSHFYWTEDNASTTTLGREWRKDECERIWEKMPDTLKQAIKSKKLNVLDLAGTLARSWKDGEWRARDDNSEFRLTGQIHLARELLERADKLG
jgi:hypothetical protein